MWFTQAEKAALQLQVEKLSLEAASKEEHFTTHLKEVSTTARLLFCGEEMYSNECSQCGPCVRTLKV